MQTLRNNAAPLRDIGIGAGLERPVMAIRRIRLRLAQEHRDAKFRETVAIDRHFTDLMQQLGARIRYLTRQYGLDDLADDAWQACAIAVHRGINAYDPDRAGFTTFVTWQLRGELQSLRHRIRLDQRQSARNANVQTVSLDSMISGPDAEAFDIVDETAVDRTQMAASDCMAEALFDRIWDDYEGKSKSDDERAIVQSSLFDRRYDTRTDLSQEQRRQISRRVTRHLAAIARTGDRFHAADGN